jgi:hypothetical protein
MNGLHRKNEEGNIPNPDAAVVIIKMFRIKIRKITRMYRKDLFLRIRSNPA